MGLKIPAIEVDEMLKVLPTLIKENDTVQGLIITSLSGVIATRNDIRDLVYRIDKKFDEQKEMIEDLKQFTEEQK